MTMTSTRRRVGAAGGPFTATPSPRAGDVAQRIAALFGGAFTALQAQAVSGVLSPSAKLEKLSLKELRALIRNLDLGSLEDLKPQLSTLLGEFAAEQAEAAARAAADRYGVTDEQLEAMLSQANEHAREWAAEHAAELVTQVGATTRDGIRDLVEAGIAGGLSNDDLAAELGGGFLFSPERSMLIARTETSFAENRGTLVGWEDSGVVSGKSWLPDVDPCPVCQLNADAGIIPLDDLFPSGDPAPPAHPNCECTILAEVIE